MRGQNFHKGNISGSVEPRQSLQLQRDRIKGNRLMSQNKPIPKQCWMVSQRLLSREPGKLRHVVRLGEVAKDNPTRSAVVILLKKLGRSVVREMPNSREHPLLHAPRIRPV